MGQVVCGGHDCPRPIKAIHTDFYLLRQMIIVPPFCGIALHLKQVQDCLIFLNLSISDNDTVKREEIKWADSRSVPFIL